MSRDAPRLLRLPEVADRLGVSLRTVRRLVASEQLSVIDVGSGSERRWRVSIIELDRFLDARTQTRDTNGDGRGPAE